MSVFGLDYDTIGQPLVLASGYTKQFKRENSQLEDSKLVILNQININMNFYQFIILEMNVLVKVVGIFM